MKILLVDDNSNNLYLLESLLNGTGYETTGASNGAEAYELALNDNFDLIISDILMPVMDGFTFCRNCKKNNVLKSIPFIFYTATYTDSKDEKFALNLGADKFVLKPQDPDTFLNIIQEIINNFKDKKIRPNETSDFPEEAMLKEYNTTLIRKLEDKMQQTEGNEKKLKDYVKKLGQNLEEHQKAEEEIKRLNEELEEKIERKTKELKKKDRRIKTFSRCYY